MAEEIRSRGQRRDRWVNWIVIGVFVVAMVAGWVVKTLAEGRTELYDEGGIQVRYPAGWVRAVVEEPLLLQVEDRWADPFPTTLTLQRRPLQASLGMVKQTLSLERTRNWGECTAYRVLQTEESVSIHGRTAMHVSFAYVETNVKPGYETEPVVMYGEDYLFFSGNQIYIATVTAAKDNQDEAHRALQTFMGSLQLPK